MGFECASFSTCDLRQEPDASLQVSGCHEDTGINPTCNPCPVVDADRGKKEEDMTVEKPDLCPDRPWSLKT